MSEVTEMTINNQGRLVIPAALRKELGFESGDALVAHAENGRLVIEKKQHLHETVWAMFGVLPKNISLADELIAERRTEANRELGDTEVQ